jgi:hypothetical protein
MSKDRVTSTYTLVWSLCSEDGGSMTHIAPYNAVLLTVAVVRT